MVVIYIRSASLSFQALLKSLNYPVKLSRDYFVTSRGLDKTSSAFVSNIEINFGRTSVRDTNKSLTAMCCIVTVTTLCSLKTLYFIEISIEVSPRRDETRTNKKYPAQMYLSASLLILYTVLLLYS